MPCFLSPAAPWVIVPAKKIPGAVALSQKGVWAGHRLEAGDGRAVGMRDADGEDDNARAVFAVRCGEHEILAIAPGGLPTAPVAHADAGALRECLEALLHFRPRGKVGCPVHEGR